MFNDSLCYSVRITILIGLLLSRRRGGGGGYSDQQISDVSAPDSPPKDLAIIHVSGTGASESEISREDPG